MSDIKKYEKLLNNPNARRALDIIAASEDSDYNTTFGGGTFDDFSKHPNIQKKFKQKDGKINSSGAAGRYGFLKGTWDDLSNRLNLNDFSPRNQDIGALALLDQTKGKDGKSALDLALEGNFQGMVEKTGNIWASFPSAPAKYSQPKHGWNKMNKIIASATGSPAVYQEETVGEPGGTDDTQQGWAINYENPADSILSDPTYQANQAALFQAEHPQQVQQGQFPQPVSTEQVATVNQSPFEQIPAIYDQAIANAFSEGESDNLFNPQIDDALRGIFDVA